MTTHDSASSTAAVYEPPTWARLLLGIVLILGGLFVLGDIALATLISALFIGYTAIIVGAFEIVHAFMTRGWGALIWRVLLGVLYIVFGWMVVSEPATGALILTFAIGMAFLALGVVRIVVALTHWSEAGWLMLISGAFGVLAGLIILAGWPASRLWVLGLLLGIDLISHGVAWLSYGWLPRAGWRII